MLIMRILSWNVRGFKANVKKGVIRRLIVKHKPDFLFLQESKIEVVKSRFFRSMWSDPEVNWVASPSEGSSGGLISAWNSKMFVVSMKIVNRSWVCLEGRVVELNFECVMINVYRPCNVDERGRVWHEITQLVRLSQKPCLVMGDFNEVLRQEDRSGRIVDERRVQEFKWFISELLLMEIHSIEGDFTLASR